ncbi:hypothetical protein BDR04DRAFT_1100559 [Suillus decipiens]|nr:hypothetical protein BDR04DRAFT_1100559 [Suillus decipiens]
MLLTGSFPTKNKDDLIDIAGALQIFTVGTKPELSIKEYFELHPELKTDECFAGLFTGCSRTGQKQSFNEGLSDDTIQNVHLPAILSQAFLPLTLLPTILTYLIHT